MTAALAPVRVLIVDDDEDEFVIAETLLQASAPGAYTVEWTPEYEDGLRRLRDASADAALIDYSLGARNGLELIEDLASDRARIPLILLTGQGDRRIEAAALAAGATDYLEKGTITGPVLERSLRYAVGRHRAAVALQRSEERFRAIVEHSTEGLALFDANRRIVFQSPAVTAILGHTPAEMHGRPLDHFLRHGDIEAHRAAFAKALLNPGMVLDTELVARHKDGSWRILECSTINRLHQPAVGAVVCNYRDVSRRRHAEEATQKASRQFRAVFEGARDGMVIADDRAQCVAANPAALALMGTTHAALRNDGLAALAPPLAAIRAGSDGAVAAGASDAFQLRRADGTMREVEFTATPNVLPGQHLVVLRDVTEQNLLEAQLRQSQKMEAIGQLAGGVAHDFNNVLTIILGYAAFLSSRPELTDEARTDACEILKAGETAASLTRRLLDFSRRTTFAPGPVDVNALIARTHALLVRLIGESIEVELALAPGLRAVVADAPELEQALINLAVNARDAMPAGGRLRIETADVVLDAAFVALHRGSAVGAHVMIAVSDTGTGMDEAVKARAFEPFFTTKPRGKGTGLGLSSVYAAVKQSHGSISIDSEAGRGLTFRIYLPASDASHGRIDAVEPVIGPAGVEAVLLVEDDDGVRGLVHQVLSRHGYAVTAAAGPREGLAILESHGPFDLLLTDVTMPFMGGREFARLCHAQRPDLRVLYMTGHAAALADAGVLDPELAILHKPFVGPALLERIRAVLDAPVAPHV